MNVSVPLETAPNERRVALVPAEVGRLAKAGIAVSVERGAGVRAGFADDAYAAAGAALVDDARALYSGADVVAKVQRPTLDEAALLREGSALVCLLNPSSSEELLPHLAARRVTALALELVPRITRAQSMDVLSSQATVAGYKAVLLGAAALAKFLPMLTTAAGTIPPSRCLVLGAGVAGLQAIATARRLGAQVSAFDVRPATREQVQSLGARFLEVEGVSAEGAGGYAGELAEEQHRRELEAVARAVKDVDLVVTTAAIPGRRAPILLTEEMVHAMRPGSVIVDVAAETGGNCALTRPGETVEVGGVTVLGPLNLPSTLPLHASQMLSRNVATLLQHLVRDGSLAIDPTDEIAGAMTMTRDGEIVRR
ncbi:MAG: Re/Si-specific NAD(P)(+) transhydrogenase subunit alpha [Gemmatimonadaceae bacterium]